MNRTIDIENYNYRLPKAMSNLTSIRLPIRLIINHLWKEKAEIDDRFARFLETILFRLRIESCRELRFRSTYLSRFGEIKRGFSNMYGRAVSRAILDRYAGVPFFDEFDRYLTASRLPKLFNQQLNVSVIDRKTGAPDYLARDKTSTYCLVEAKGRIKRYGAKTLGRFVAQSQNAHVFFGNQKLRHKSWAVPIYLSFGDTSSFCSIVDPENESRYFVDDLEFAVLRFHYANNFVLLGHYNIALILAGVRREITEIEKMQFYLGTINTLNGKKTFIFSADIGFLPFFYLQRTGLWLPSTFVFGLDFSIARIIKSMCVRGEFNFRDILQICSKSDVNSEEMHGYSNDGSIVCAVEDFETVKLIEY